MAMQPATAAEAAAETDVVPVTVVIPAYNREKMIGRAVASALAQRPRPPSEVVVVDDGSGDGTAEAARAAGARVIVHDRNRGESRARNTGIEAATQPWIALLDSDDEWLPGHLAALWRVREGHVVAAASALRCGDDPALDRVHGSPGARALLLRTPADLLFPENPIPGSAGMVRRDVALAVGGYDEAIPLCEDLDLLLRCLEHGTGVVAPDVTAIYHMHPGQLSSQRGDMRAWHTRVASAYSSRPWWSRRQFSRWLASAAWDDFRADAGSAAAALRRPAALARLLVWRLRIRRRSARLSRDGGPSVAFMPGARAPQETRPGARVVDLRDRSRLAALAQLARRPAGAAVVGSRADALLVRLAGVPPVERS
jgi:glycosyltransferase involved in cell wall biosynthesis